MVCADLCVVDDMVYTHCFSQHYQAGLRLCILYNKLGKVQEILKITFGCYSAIHRYININQGCDGTLGDAADSPPPQNGVGSLFVLLMHIIQNHRYCSKVFKMFAVFYVLNYE